MRYPPTSCWAKTGFRVAYECWKRSIFEIVKENGLHENSRKIQFPDCVCRLVAGAGATTSRRRTWKFRAGIRHDVRRARLENSCARGALLRGADYSDAADSGRRQPDIAAR